MRGPFLLAATLLVPAVMPLAAQKPPPGTVSVGELGTRLDGAVTVADPTFWGAVAVSRAGQLLLAKGYGIADGNKQPIGPTSLFDCGGFAQQFTALAALQLVQDRKLQLDQPLAHYLPDWPADKAAMTAGHLLQHRSGLPDEVRWEGAAANAMRSALHTIAGCKLLTTPGGTQRYTPLDAVLLALLVEQLSGQRFERYVQERVFQRAGMKDTGFYGDRSLDRGRLTMRRIGGDAKGKPCNDLELNWAHRGARGVLTTAFDLHEFAAALLGGKLLAADLLATLWQPVPGGDVYRIGPVGLGAAELLEVHGAISGYRMRLLVHQPTATSVVVWTHERGPLQAVQQALLFVLAADAWRQGAPQAPEPGAAGAAPGAPAPTVPSASAPGQGTPQATAAGASRFVGVFAVPGGGRFELTQQDGVLMLAGIGLQPAARVQHGQWPPTGQEDNLRRAEDAVLSHLDAMVQDQRTAFADAFVGDEPALLGRAVWDGLIRAHGKPQASEVVGITTDRPVAWCTVTFGTTPVLLRAALGRDRRFNNLTAATEPHPFRRALQIERADVATAKTPAGMLSVTVEGDGETRRLVFEDRTPGIAGLLDCPLVVR